MVRKGNVGMNIDRNQYGTAYQSGQRVGYCQGYMKESGASLGEKQETGTKSEEPKSYREQILEKMAEMEENIRKGTIQPKFQIGAQAYTIEEWEKLLQKFDAVEEVMREEVQAQIEEAKKQAEKEALQRAAECKAYDSGSATHVTYVSEKSEGAKVALAADMVGTAAGETVKSTDVKTDEEMAALLTGEATKCSYPTEDPK